MVRPRNQKYTPHWEKPLVLTSSPQLFRPRCALRSCFGSITSAEDNPIIGQRRWGWGLRLVGMRRTFNDEEQGARKGGLRLSG